MRKTDSDSAAEAEAETRRPVEAAFWTLGSTEAVEHCENAVDEHQRFSDFRGLQKAPRMCDEQMCTRQNRPESRFRLFRFRGFLMISSSAFERFAFSDIEAP